MNILPILFVIVFLGGCNAIIGIPTHMEDQPWRSLHLISLLSILIIPILSVFALVLSFWRSSLFKLKLQKYLNMSIIVVVVLWVLGEMSLTSNTNIRLDLFFTIPAICVQLATVLIGRYITKSINVTSDKTLKSVA